MKIDEIEDLLKESYTDTSEQCAMLLERAIEIYRSTRVDNTNIDKNGDMLLFRWGNSGREQDVYFEVNLTRVIVLDLNDPDEALHSMRQLKIIFRYPCCAETDSFGKRNSACASPTEITDFLVRVKSSKAFTWLQTTQPSSVSISLGH